MCGYSLEVPQWGTSNEYPQHMFLRRTRENYPRVKYDKTCNETCVTSKDSDRPVHPPSMAMILVHPSLDSPEAVEDTVGSVNTRIRLHGCAGWPESLLVAQVLLQTLSCAGSFMLTRNVFVKHYAPQIYARPYKMPKLERGITLKKLIWFFSTLNQVINSSAQISLRSF